MNLLLISLGGLMILMVVIFGTFESVNSLLEGGNLIELSSSRLTSLCAFLDVSSLLWYL